MNRKLELKQSLREAEREYDLCYLQIMKTLHKFGEYAKMKEWAEHYLVVKKELKKKMQSYEHPPIELL